MDSPAPSPTNAKININPAIDTAVGIAVPIDADTNAKIDINPTIDTAVGIALPFYTDANTEISIDTIIDTTIDTVAGITMSAIIDVNPWNQRSTAWNRSSSTSPRQTSPISFRPRLSSAQLRARREQF
jgi:hypothetical protein